jgi:hypothetical protein
VRQSIVTNCHVIADAQGINVNKYGVTSFFKRDRATPPIHPRGTSREMNGALINVNTYGVTYVFKRDRALEYGLVMSVAGVQPATELFPPPPRAMLTEYRDHRGRPAANRSPRTTLPNIAWGRGGGGGGGKVLSPAVQCCLTLPLPKTLLCPVQKKGHKS